MDPVPKGLLGIGMLQMFETPFVPDKEEDREKYGSQGTGILIPPKPESSEWWAVTCAHNFKKINVNFEQTKINGKR